MRKGSVIRGNNVVSGKIITGTSDGTFTGGKV